MKILLVGAGPMAIDYAKVLTYLKLDYSVIGRGSSSAKNFMEKCDKEVLLNGLEESYPKLGYKPDYAIIASTFESLEENTVYLLNQGVKNILLEKPGALNSNAMRRIKELAILKKAEVYIGYNRRFYNSVIEAKKLIEEDGGLLSFLFEFTEWSQVVEQLGKNEVQLANWFIGNSTHVLDTAFYFGGLPKQWNGFKQSHIEWHPEGSIFVGSGITEKNILFSYHANWNAPGSWKLELLTSKNRYIFRPFEKLHVQRKGSIEIKEIPVDQSDQDDTNFKPGLFKEVSSFLKDSSKANLLSVKEAEVAMHFYENVLYNSKS